MYIKFYINQTLACVIKSPDLFYILISILLYLVNLNLLRFLESSYKKIYQKNLIWIRSSKIRYGKVEEKTIKLNNKRTQVHTIEVKMISYLRHEFTFSSYSFLRLQEHGMRGFQELILFVNATLRTAKNSQI